MIYQSRDLGVVAVAALGAGFLAGAAQPPASVPAINGITIVKRLELPPPSDAMEQWRAVWRVAVPLSSPLMIETPPPVEPEQTEPEQTEPEAVQRERAMLQPERPRDGCYPGRRENFWYRGVLHWRCRYGR
jgi:hypothetical protein